MGRVISRKDLADSGMVGEGRRVGDREWLGSARGRFGGESWWGSSSMPEASRGSLSPCFAAGLRQRLVSFTWRVAR